MNYTRDNSIDSSQKDIENNEQLIVAETENKSMKIKKTDLGDSRNLFFVLFFVFFLERSGLMIYLQFCLLGALRKIVVLL